MRLETCREGLIQSTVWSVVRHGHNKCLLNRNISEYLRISIMKIENIYYENIHECLMEIIMAYTFGMTWAK